MGLLSSDPASIYIGVNSQQPTANSTSTVPVLAARNKWPSWQDGLEEHRNSLFGVYAHSLGRIVQAKGRRLLCSSLLYATQVLHSTPGNNPGDC